ncbi:uncharacterized protein LOC110901201 [Helianthus annuus]|uniref:uncharacterized protein LOC110901201 n=1 Tax=Helianthus annuus TaxID=4232 RepID=UPI000B901371|nr:uncharacterized protein LOC110901201 [Helianthus annuus]
MDLILLDEKGRKIQAWIKAPLIPVFISQLHEDEVVILSRFGVGENTDAHKVINHGYKINFYRCTVVTRANGWQGVDYGFNFIAHSHILNRDGKDLLTCGITVSDNLIYVLPPFSMSLISVAMFTILDVAGIVVSCGDMEIFPNERKKMNLDLQDVQGEVVRCTLWIVYAQELNHFFSQNSPNETVMAVIQHARIRKWQGQYTVQSDKFGSRLFLNQEIDEINELRKSLLVKQFEAGASSSQTILSSQSVFAVPQEFLIETPKRHVDEIIEIDSGMSCVVVATIKIVQQNYGWFYPACRDYKKKVLTKIEYLQYAKTISDEVMNLSPASLNCYGFCCNLLGIYYRFKVHLRVQDETGSVSFVMFDKDVMKLIGPTANDIRERQVKLDDTETFPHEISRLVEKKLAFKIEVSDYNLNHDYHVYTIQKVCDDPDIIAELVGGNGNALEVADEVFSQKGSEVKAVQLSESSQMAGANISKDVVSVMADSSVVEAEKDSTTSPNGKRSLQDVEGQNVGELSSNNKRNRRKPSRLDT